MSEQRLQNIFNILSKDPSVELKANSFEEWKSSFLTNDSIQNNVHGYLTRNNLTGSDVNTWKSNVGVEKEKGATSVQKIDASVPPPTSDQVNQFNIAAEGEGFLDRMGATFQKEKRIASFLDDYYSNTEYGDHVSFHEAKGGKDAIEVLVGDQQPGEGKEFRFSGGLEFAPGEKIWDELMGKGTESFSNEDQFHAITTHVKTMLEEGKKDEMLEGILNTVDSSKLNAADNPKDKINFLNQIDVGAGNESKDRDLTEAQRMQMMGVIGDHTEVDMTGSIQIGDMTVPLKYIWDNRKELHSLAIQKSNQEIKKADIDEYGETVIETSDNPLTGTKITGVTGVKSEYAPDLWSHSSKWTQSSNLKRILNISEDIETLMGLSEKELLETPEKGMEDIVIKGGSSPTGYVEDIVLSAVPYKTKKEKLENLTKLLKEKLEKEGIKPLWKNDDPKSGFIDIKKTMQNHEDITFTEEDIEQNDNAELLARDNDIHALSNIFLDKDATLMNAIKDAVGNEDEMWEKTNFIVRNLGAAIDTEQDNFGHDMTEFKKVLKKGDLEGANLSKLPGNHPSAEFYNNALEEYITVSKALLLNQDHSKNPQENLLVEVMDDLSESFTGERLVHEVTRDDQVAAFEYMLEEAGYDVPDQPKDFMSVRGAAEGTAQVITDLAPLLVELAVLKKIGPNFMSTITKGVSKKMTGKSMKKIATMMTGGRKLPKFYKNLYKKHVVPSIAGGIATTAEWTTAELAGQAALVGKHKLLILKLVKLDFLFLL